MELGPDVGEELGEAEVGLEEGELVPGGDEGELLGAERHPDVALLQLPVRGLEELLRQRRAKPTEVHICLAHSSLYGAKSTRHFNLKF